MKLHSYSDYRWLRGFNIIPSWGARIEEAWWNYDGDRFREEAALAVPTHANCIRLWIEFSAWMADPDKAQADFMDAVTAIGELGMTTMPCLFNRWHDGDYDYGGTYVEDFYRNMGPKIDYIRAIVEPLIDDERILLWDLCNEPQVHRLDDPIAALELSWMAQIADAVRQTGVRQPITIGTHQAGRNMDIYAPFCDVMCCHAYGKTREEQTQMLEVCAQVQQRHRKPMMSNETVPGSVSDDKRADCARWTIELMENAGYGWMGWGMREGKAISTRRDRMDGNGIGRTGFSCLVHARRPIASRPGVFARTAAFFGALENAPHDCRFNNRLNGPNFGDSQE